MNSKNNPYSSTQRRGDTPSSRRSGRKALNFSYRSPKGQNNLNMIATPLSLDKKPSSKGKQNLDKMLQKMLKTRKETLREKIDQSRIKDDSYGKTLRDWRIRKNSINVDRSKSRVKQTPEKIDFSIRFPVSVRSKKKFQLDRNNSADRYEYIKRNHIDNHIRNSVDTDPRNGGSAKVKGNYRKFKMN